MYHPKGYVFLIICFGLVGHSFSHFGLKLGTCMFVEANHESISFHQAFHLLMKKRERYLSFDMMKRMFFCRCVNFN